jgi:septation ring formation regulator EzrA
VNYSGTMYYSLLELAEIRKNPALLDEVFDAELSQLDYKIKSASDRIEQAKRQIELRERDINYYQKRVKEIKDLKKTGKGKRNVVSR